jgi:hypothetical protein
VKAADRDIDPGDLETETRSSPLYRETVSVLQRSRTVKYSLRCSPPSY